MGDFMGFEKWKRKKEAQRQAAAPAWTWIPPGPAGENQTSNWNPAQEQLAYQMIRSQFADIPAYAPIRQAKNKTIMDFMGATPNMNWWEEAVGAPAEYQYGQKRTALEQSLGPNYWSTAKDRSLTDLSAQYLLGLNQSRAQWAKTSEQDAARQKEWAAQMAQTSDPYQIALQILGMQPQNTIVEQEEPYGILNPRAWF